jgi:hypothetical protein
MAEQDDAEAWEAVMVVLGPTSCVVNASTSTTDARLSGFWGIKLVAV